MWQAVRAAADVAIPIHVMKVQTGLDLVADERWSIFKFLELNDLRSGVITKFIFTVKLEAVFWQDQSYDLTAVSRHV